MSYVGVDVGTSVIKAAMFDETGRQVALEAAPAKVLRPRDGWFEQDPDEVVAAVAQVIGRVVSGSGRAPELIALTGQGDGVWLLDKDGRGVRPAVSWMDARAAGIVDRWQAEGVVEAAFRRNGGAMFPGCPAPVLAWLDSHEPAVLDRATTAAYCKDMVMQRLTGVRATDPSDASLPFLDPGSRTYATDLLERCGLAHRAGLLAPVVEPYPTGALTREAADLLGVAAGTPVTAGPFDLPACALGCGVEEPGDGHLIVGTTLACQVVIDKLDLAGEPAGLTIAYGARKRWLRAMPAMVGTAALDWVLTLVGLRHDQVDGILAGTKPGAGGVTCLPYFSPAGERAPFVESGARARFDGLTVQTSGADLVRAVCEGIAFAARHCLEAAGVRGDIACCGGGVRSRQWLRMFADVLGRQVRVATRPEVGAYGAVLAGIGAVSADAGARSWTEPDISVQPGSDLMSEYAERYEHYRAAVDRARMEWKERQA
ncbi:FGGY-family carbohydrate kinase [Actinopolymorpha alba]|uniref:FGGY-family carbohydrate kinase n=1 Tax=Actinopolymorpha alba TaxID=533267 RepID=UPI00036032A2|nr:FGGY-family carbohydrate kinase [Actinopolymorpha alba]